MMKTLYLIRHGEGHHNVAAGKKIPKPADDDPDYAAKLVMMTENHAMREKIYQSEEYRDAALSDRGVEQCQQLRQETDRCNLTLLLIGVP